MRLHHLHISCKNLTLAKSKFIQTYGFKEYGIIATNSVLHDSTSFESHAHSVVLQLKSIFIILTERDDLDCDTIDDVSFTVESVKECCDKAASLGAEILVKPKDLDKYGNTMLSEKDSVVTKAVIKSPIGNVKHTILSKGGNFDFLPGFIRSETSSHVKHTNNIECIDHIAYAVKQNESEVFIQWYNAVFGLERYYSSNIETVNGLVVKSAGGNGLRMLTLIGHPYPNRNVAVANEIEARKDKLKFVFAESLARSGSDQIQKFLNNHGEAGVQHIAFYTSSILNDAQLWLENGVKFIKPPRAYYQEIEDTLQVLRENTDITKIEDIGVLIDCENSIKKTGFLYQIFTQSVMESDTFFFELIQRDNHAKGFGVGNVSALWRALENHVQTNK